MVCRLEFEDLIFCVRSLESRRSIMEEENKKKRKVERTLAVKRDAKLKLPRHLMTKDWTPDWHKKHGKDPGTAELLPYHRAKLRAVLAALLREHCYPAAAGVVSCLFGASNVSDQQHHRDLNYFWAAMEVLRQVEGGKPNPLKIKRLYRHLHRKQSNQKIRGEVQMELAIYLMSLGDYASYEAAYNEIRPIIDIPPFRDDPVVNFCHGLTLHRLWYDRAVQDVAKHFVNDLGARRQHGENQEDYEESGGENDMEVEEHREEITKESTFRVGQLTDEGSALGEDMEALDIAGTSYASSQGIQRGLYEDDEDEYQLEDFWRKAVVQWSPDLDKRLFPVRLPQSRTKMRYIVPMDTGRTRDAYVNGIKYFRRAKALAPNLTPALLPLVQLLLAGGRVKEAVEEIDKCCDSPHLLPLSIKALLLETIDSKDFSLLTKCYSSILQINPSSSQAIDSLIRLHAAGKYRTEALVECIAIYLDVELGLLEIWKQLAACLLLLDQRWEKASREGKFEDGQLPETWEEDIVNLEQENKSQASSFLVWMKETWEDRSQWWKLKHFHERSVDVEQQHDGDWKRIAFKAACAAHITGPGTLYETVVCNGLTTIHADSLLELVKLHSDRSLHRLAQTQRSMGAEATLL